jgi:hypothetical protein
MSTADAASASAKAYEAEVQVAFEAIKAHILMHRHSNIQLDITSVPASVVHCLTTWLSKLAHNSIEYLAQSERWVLIIEWL